MTGSLPRLACVAWLLLGAAAAQAQGVLVEEVEACLAVIERDSTRTAGGDPMRLGEGCRALAEHLAEGPWGATLEVPPERLDAVSLRQLHRLLEVYDRDTPTGPVVSTEPLAAVVAELAPFDVPPGRARWERFVEWLEEWLGADARGAGWFEWLRDLAAPEGWDRGIASVAAAIIVLAALVLVIGGLIAAIDRLGRNRFTVPVRLAPGQSTASPDLDGLPATRQPPALLAMITDRLRRQSPERFRDSMTHRELVAAAAHLEESQRRAIQSVAAAAERITFGTWRPSPRDVEPIVRQGRAMLEALSEEAKGAGR